MTTTISGSNGIVFPDTTSLSTTPPADQVKAWVNFSGSGTVSIRAGYNVSSITDNGIGNYTVNFTTAMANTDYSVVGSAQLSITADRAYPWNNREQTTTSASGIHYEQNTPKDTAVVCVAIFQ